MKIEIDQKIIDKITDLITKKLPDANTNEYSCFITCWMDNTYKIEVRHANISKKEIHRFILYNTKNTYNPE